MAMLAQGPYKIHDFALTGLTGISDKAIEVHKGLYAGYVRNVNTLNERIAALAKEGKASTPDYAELTRRLGFEYSGMVLHEYYFGNLKTGAVALDPNSAFGKAVVASFGGVESWLADFRAIATMRGVGWAVVFQDPVTGWLSNHWLTLHQDGVPVSFKPILVLDVWEHAFMVDYVPAERPKYIDAFFKNVDWVAVDARLSAPSAARPIG